LLARYGRSKPSFVLLRQVNALAPDQLAELLLASLPSVVGDLETGAIVMISPNRLRVRQLPIVPVTPDP